MNNNFNDAKKLAEKIHRNSFCELCEGPNYFYFYSNEKAKEISKIGKDALSKMMKNIEWATSI